MANTVFINGIGFPLEPGEEGQALLSDGSGNLYFENITGSENDGGGDSGGDSNTVWGDITGTLSNQTDLQGELDGKAPHENGHADRSTSTISFTNGTRTFSIQPTAAEFEYYVDNTPFTSTGDTLAIPDSEGLHYIYYDETGTLVSTQTFTPELITKFAFTAAIYWDATNNEAILFEDERHGSTMDSATHIYNHVTFGTRYESGLGLINIQVDGTGDVAADAQVGVNGGTIWDEDIDIIIANGAPQTLSPVAQIPMFYRSGAAGDWRREAADNYPVVNTGTGLMAWNEDTGATWQLTEASTGDYVVTHLFATGDVNHPIIGIVGQAVYNTKNEARQGAETELSSITLGSLEILAPEYVPIASLIFETKTTFSNTPRGRIISTDAGDDYIDWRVTLRSSSPSSAGSTIAWGDITGILSNQADLQNALNAKIEVELDPVFSISPAAGITNTDITNWDTAYSWGDHSTAGYLTNVSWGDIGGTLSNQTDLQIELNGKADTGHTHAASDVTSGTFVDARISQTSVTQHEAALSITESQITDLGSYAAASHTHAASDVTSGTFVDARISQTSVTQHEAALSITESQITDLGSYALASHTHAASDVTSGTFADARISQTSVTQHEAALSITESQITDLGSYLVAGSAATITAAWTLNNATLVEYTETTYSLSGTTPAIDPANGTVQTWTLTGNSTPTDSLADGQSVLLMIDDGSAHTITWTMVDEWVGGSAPTLATTGYTAIELWKVGTTVYGAHVGDLS